MSLTSLIFDVENIAPVIRACDWGLMTGTWTGPYTALRPALPLGYHLCSIESPLCSQTVQSMAQDER